MIEFDDNLKHELMAVFDESYRKIEQDLGHLNSDPSDERLNTLFDAIHDTRGHTSKYTLHGITDYAQALENVIQSLRSRSLSPSIAVCECLQLGLDRLRDLHQRDVYGHEFAPLNEPILKARFNELANATPDEAASCAYALLECLGFGHAFGYSQQNEKPAFALPDRKLSAPPSASDKQFLDLAFFQELSLQVDSQSPFWVDRSAQLYDWTQRLNHFAGDKVDYQQLAAATYMHDVGMSFLRARIHNNNETLTETEQSEMQRHVAWGYDILIRIPGWEEAALIVLNHHERPDGQGYPNKLRQQLIHPGAKILAIVDAFFSMVRGRADRPQKKSVIRAMAEINARSGSQFDPMWVEAFNELVKDELRNGRL